MNVIGNGEFSREIHCKSIFVLLNKAAFKNFSNEPEGNEERKASIGLDDVSVIYKC